jgi:hypothetical protein
LTKLYNEELQNLYSSPDVIRKIKIEANSKDETCSMQWTEERCLQNINKTFE